MASAITSKVTLQGSFEPLVRGFTDKTERGILRRALRRTAQQTVIKTAKANLRAGAGKRYAKDLTVKTTVTNKVANARIGAKKKSTLGKLGHLFEGGTSRHPIRVSTKKVLVVDGEIFMGRRVIHPGTQARPWLKPALEDNKSQVVGTFRGLTTQEINKAIAKGKR